MTVNGGHGLISLLHGDALLEVERHLLIIVRFARDGILGYLSRLIVNVVMLLDMMMLGVGMMLVQMLGL